MKPLEEAVTKAKAVLSNATASLEEFKSATEAITQASHTLSAKLYESSKGSGGAGGGTGGDGGGGAGGASGSGTEGGGETKADGEDVIDADYKDVN